MELTRFYLQLKEDPHGPNVALFVGNLPPNQNEKTYETIIRDFLDEGVLGRGCRRDLTWFSIGRPAVHVSRADLLRVRLHGDHIRQFQCGSHRLRDTENQIIRRQEVAW